MIKLTGKSGLAIYVNPDKIIGFNEEVNSGSTFINYGDDCYIVTESPSEVASKVLEWRLEMEAYKQSVLGNNFNISADCASRLRILAGLED